MQDRTEERPARPGETCTHELCDAARHDPTTTVRHHRTTSDEAEPYLVVARWTEDDVTAARVELTHQDITVTLTPHDAAFWARVLISGTAYGRQATIAVDLGVAAELLALLDENGAPPVFGSRYLGMNVDRVLSRIMDDEEADR